ncbi:drug/metabolite exporter YedA [Streptomyces albospinus]|uniref:Drug/metabolite exporter YedA n=1 Tax=Streptomyces albospinus TaxID=285515 RepID=A0ABQ2V2D3_9ACTN|nr:EamA family transporter [Streptomyces albospinus]GGU65266.1 drug/metabolite exporter YedA [Streptomyces albospinus]
MKQQTLTPPPVPTQPRNRLWLTWAALICVYLAWGGTFPAYQVLLRTAPPVLSMGVRCLLCGGVLCVWIRLCRPADRPLRVSGAQFLGASLIGVLVLGAIALTAVAEREVPAGTAALVIGSVPLWVVCLRVAHGERVAAALWIAVVFGFGGSAMVILQGAQSSPPMWMGIMVVAAIMEAAGTFYASRVPRPPEPLRNTAVQLLVVGALCVALSGPAGEWRHLDVGGLSADSLWAFAYLTAGATLLAYTAFAWLAANHPPSLVATYAYVNPVVGVIVSWFLLHEALSPGELVGAALTVCSVAVVVYLESRLPERR